MSQPTPWADAEPAKHITLQELVSYGDPELSPEQSVAIVESICRNPRNCEIIRFLSQRASGHLLARAMPSDGSPLPATEEAWQSLCSASEAALSSCIGSVMSMLIADGLGHSTEFVPVDMRRKLPWMPSSSYAPQALPSEWVPWIEREQPAGKALGIIGQFLLKPGQWTDDSSMGLCLLDSLIAKPGFDALDCMMRFVMWTNLGYNNAFGFDPERRRDPSGFGRGSVGLGGNISLSIDGFMREPRGATVAGDFNTNGNGSVMRLCPVAVRFWRDRSRAMDAAALSSLTTHQGIEAALCCRLLAFVTCAMIQAADVPVAQRSQAAFRALFEQTLAAFLLEPPPACEDPESLDPGSRVPKRVVHDAAVAGVRAIASSQSQGVDRNWNWKDKSFTYSPSRTNQQRGYVGSYCMDAMSMAFYRCYHSDDYLDAVLRAAGMGGDADSVGSIVGQILGAYYGHTAIPFSWARAVWRWDQGSTLSRVRKLYAVGLQ
jgi:ADP-ribosyl-[dinitrogen reductase] hydrolase